MELQRILAKDSRTAMEQVHAKFGKDALVVSNKRARNKTELIVAIELEEGSAAALEEMQFQGDDSLVNLQEDSTSFDQVMESKVFKTIPDSDVEQKTLLLSYLLLQTIQKFSPMLETKNVSNCMLAKLLT